MNKLPAKRADIRAIVANLPESTLRALVHTLLAELRRGVSESEIWGELDPLQLLPWQTRRAVLTRLITDGRIEHVNTEDRRVGDTWIQTYRLIPAKDTKQRRLF